MTLRNPFRKYSWNAFWGDVGGGFLAALIALPYGLAIASLMGLPPVLGIFTSILTAPITALFGRNPVLIGGVSSVTVPFVVAAVKSHGIGGAAKISILAAVIMLVFSFLRLGRFVAKVPHTVMAGFSSGPNDVFAVLPNAFGLAFVSSINLLVTSRVVEHFRGRHTPLKAVDADRELGAYAIANMAAGMFGAPLSVGIPARSVASI